MEETRFFEVSFRMEVKESDVETLKTLNDQKCTDGFVPFEPLKGGARLWHFKVEELNRDRYVPKN